MKTHVRTRIKENKNIAFNSPIEVGRQLESFAVGRKWSKSKASLELIKFALSNQRLFDQWLKEQIEVEQRNLAK
jgi:hypothetical protein